MSFDAERLAAAADGYWWLGRKYAGEAVPVTDSRGDLHGKVFFAIRGERFDGHDFLLEAGQRGAAAVVADSVETRRCAEAAAAGIPVMLVPDTLRAYQRAGQVWRENFPKLTAAAVTGSVGKTAVKEMLRAIFTAASSPEEVLATSGNTNNQIGVPLNLLRLEERHRFAVVEMGTNHHGEIAALAPLAGASVSVVTAIAACHLEHLGDLEGVAFEKGHIFSGSPEDSAAVIPAGAPGEAILRRAAGARRVLTFGRAGSGADMELLAAEATFLTPGRVAMRSREGVTIELEWRLPGEYLALDACAAAQAALLLGIPGETIAAGLAGTVLPGMRARVIRRGSCVWVLDAYNANPASMEALIVNMAGSDRQGRRLIMVLGDMLELGSGSSEAHRQVLRLVRERLPECELLLVGEAFAAAQAEERVPAAECFAAAAEVKSRLAAASDAVIALKASHSIGLEKALPADLTDALQ